MVYITQHPTTFSAPVGTIRRIVTKSCLVAAAVAALISTRPDDAAAQHERHAGAKPDSARAASTMQRDPAHDVGDLMEGPLGLSEQRMGSGTAWMPDSSPMYAVHKMSGDWTVMMHGAAFGQYDDQGSTRGDKQLGVIDWGMLMASRAVGTGMLHLNAMMSLEPLTIGAKGYPLLLQTGESYKGQPLHDRQHPHDAFMELAAMFQQPVASNLAVELYAGPAGEPALGPVAFMHRPSASNDPLAPLGHHWQDATHISFGLATAGLYSRSWKLEGSWFNGREPDENRWDFDLRRFDSYSGRLTVNPNGRVSLAGWYGYLPSPEALHPDEQVHRYGTSLMYAGRGIAGGAWGSTLLWGANRIAGRVENSVLAETNLEIGQKNSVFGRAEYVRKSAQDLVLGGIAPEQQFDVNSLVAGYIREIASVPGGSIGLGGRVSVNFIPAALQPSYGTRTPAGIDVYVRIRPKRMANESMAGMTMPRDTITSRMPGMKMPDKKMPGMPMPGTPTPGIPMSEMQPPPKKAPAAGQAMPMQMPTDSSRVGKDTSAAMHRMPGMAGMSMSHDTSVRPKHARAGHRATRPKMASAHTRRAAKAGKASDKSRKKATGHTMPGMQQHMPGMKMPGDSTPRRKP